MTSQNLLENAGVRNYNCLAIGFEFEKKMEENVESVEILDCVEITANQTIEIYSNQMACYNYKGISYRLFASKEDAIKYIETQDNSLIVEEFSDETELDEYLNFN